MVDADSPDPFIPREGILNSMISEGEPSQFTLLYCSCGRFVDIDRNVILRKKMLHKPVECNVCRNRRIAGELAMLDSHYSVVEELAL